MRPESDGRPFLGFPDSVARSVDRDGFALVRGANLKIAPEYAAAFGELRLAWGALPVDPYLKGATYRYRRHGAFRWADGRLEPLAEAGYFQSAEHNTFAGGLVRRFAGFGTAVRYNAFLRALLEHDLRVFRTLAPHPAAWRVDAHLVRVVASERDAGRPSPEGVHRDGFDFIALHHIGRDGVRGGQTRVYDPAERLLLRHEMRDPFDSLYADDERIMHDVTEIVAVAGTGYRDMLLTSYATVEDDAGPLAG